jgi:hypothetical protein
MDSEPDAILTGRLSEADSISIPKAARRLGLDAYTLCTLIQRERTQAMLSPSLRTPKRTPNGLKKIRSD